MRRLIALLLLDAAALTALIIGMSLWADAFATFVRTNLGGDARFAHAVVIGVALVLGLPFCIGIVRLTQRLGLLIAAQALPVPHGKVDLGAAPRRLLAVTLQLGGTLLVGAPIVALTQPFLPGIPTALVLTLGLGGIGVSFFRSAANLQGHVRAGAQVIVEALASQSRAPATLGSGESLADLEQLLPGFGDLVPVKLTAGSAALGRSLAELNVRGLTGATVLAISRGSQSLLLPAAEELLLVSDVVVLAGTHDAVAAAAQLLGAQVQGVAVS